MQALAPDELSRPIRSPEFIYRGWEWMAGTKAREAFLSECPAIRRGVEQTRNGVPALLEFITAKDHTYSVF